MIVTIVDFFYSAETKKATRLRWLDSKWKSDGVFRQPRCLAAQLSQRDCRNAVVASDAAHGGEDGGFCEAKLCPSERHSWMNGWCATPGMGCSSVFKQSARVEYLRWVKAELSEAPLQPFERPTWMSCWTQLQGSMTSSRLLR